MVSRFNVQTNQALEFDKIRQIVYDLCKSEITREIIFDSEITRSIILKDYQRQTEFIQLNSQLIEFPFHTVIDLRDVLSKLHIENYFIEIDQLHAIRSLSNNIFEIKSLFKELNNAIDFRLLSELASSCFYDPTPAREINRVIQEDGSIKYDASPELKRIFERKKNIEHTIHKAFQSALIKAKDADALHEIGESMRNGRRVLAVLAEKKRSIKGISIDESESGRIVYIEPADTIFLNNEATELNREELREIRRILIELTHKFSKYAMLFETYQNFMISWDILFAKFKFYRLIEGVIPKVGNQIEIKNGFHPLLKIKNRNENRTIVPFTLRMEDKKMLMISGPNAGGKSITLKSIGLMALMVQAALPIAAEGETVFPLFQNVLGDIGDLQSLENELSTYSSKLVLWKEMIHICDQNTLLLFDELGSGTDPAFGAGMAQSTIESCLLKNPVIIATTHYSDLKRMGELHPKAMSGSMLFDENRLEPTFQLMTDKPGSSYTFHIARKVGLSEHIVHNAERYSQTEQVKYDKMLLRLEKKENELRLRMKELEKSELELKKQMKDWNRLHLDLDLSRKKIKYEKLIQNKDLGVKKVQELKAYQNELKRIEQQRMLEEQKKLEEEIRAAEDESKKLYREIHRVKLDHVFAEGDTVQYIHTQAKGVIQKLEKRKAVVLFDNMKTTLSLADLIPIEKEERNSIRPKKILVIDKQINRELDLRGKYIYEALPELEDFVNKALLNNFYEAKIIYGLGKLKSEVLRKIKSMPSIAKIDTLENESGSSGSCIIYF